jgi:hypothetical protein
MQLPCHPQATERKECEHLESLSLLSKMTSHEHVAPSLPLSTERQTVPITQMPRDLINEPDSSEGLRRGMRCKFFGRIYGESSGFYCPEVAIIASMAGWHSAANPTGECSSVGSK